MKDSYSFDRDEEGLAASYDLHVEAYDRIMERSGLRFYKVQSDVGMMGGHGAHEYMAPCAAGENEVALAGSYAANVEVASAEPQPVQLPAPLDQPAQEHTPGLTTVEQVAGALRVPQGALLKAYPVIVEGDADSGDRDGGGAAHAAGSGSPRRIPGRIALVLVRGDHMVNEVKLANALGARTRPARAEEIEATIGPPGFIGPVGLQGRVEILLDQAVAEGCYVTGANAPDTHLRGVMPGRDFPFRSVDVRSVCQGDTIGGAVVQIEPAIEVGNIFKLGTRYSEPLGARFLDETGVERPVFMGCYGIGPARIAAAAVEQYADEQGISWPKAIAPFAVHLVSLGKPGTPERQAADGVYRALCEAGVEVIYDDRQGNPGEKFADAELLGCPLRLTVGKRSLDSGEIEVQVRRGRQGAPGLPLAAAQADLPTAVQRLCRELP